MLSKTNRWIFVSSTFLLVVLLALLSMPAAVSAAPVTGATSNSCLGCHEDLYYLHDTGCWYCITAHQDRCVGCHEGNPAEVKKEESHLGMILHPQENNGEKCLECHAVEDAQMRLVEFESVQGFDTVLQPETYVPAESVAAGFPDVAEPNPLETWPWLVGGIVLFGFWLALVFMSPQKP